MSSDYRVVVVLAVVILTSFAFMYTDLRNKDEIILGRIGDLASLEGQEKYGEGNNNKELEELTKQLQKLPATESEFQTLLNEGRDCLLLNTQKRWKQCFGDLRRKIWMRELDELEKLPREQLKKFFTPNFYQPFDLFPVTYDCDPNNLKRVGGEGDGGKWICEPLVTPTGCTIISIGSFGNFNFEKGMHDFTQGKCKIYTFDCTGTWSNPVTEFHSWCVSGRDYTESGRTYKRLSTIVKELGITGITYLKMDIEGYEWKVLPDILNETNPVALPNQISFELHVDITNAREGNVGPDGDWLTPTLSLARLLDKTGYRVAINEHNIYCKVCTELIIIRAPLKEQGKRYIDVAPAPEE